MTEHEHDDTAARLRAALRAEADMVEPSDDGLRTIRRGVGDGERVWWQRPAAIAVAAAVVLGLVVGGGVALLGGGEDGEGTVVASDPTQTPSSPEPSPTEPASSSPSASPAPLPVEGDVYVYYVQDEEGGFRLYREQQGNTGAEPAVSALGSVLGTPPADPDYRTLWPEGTQLVDYSVEGDLATVNLSAFPRLGAAGEELAVQQVVYTVTANAQAVRRVRLLVNGDVPPSGHADLEQPLTRAPMVDVQGFVWLLSPAQGEDVTSPVTITGYGTAFEGTVSWDVRAQGSDQVVAEGFTQAGANGEFADFSDTVELEPGSYVLRAFESSAEDGRPIHIDSKSFTVAP